MAFTEIIVLILEIIGTIAFAFSGATLAMKRRMDIFGVIVLGASTAVGGGVIRDIILGITPPAMFVNPVYVGTAAATSLALFALIYYRSNVWDSQYMLFSVRIINAFDSIGLGVFTVTGINTAIAAGHRDNEFLLVFVGTVTGIGGGILRDVMAGTIPTVLHKRVYAIASITGGMIYTILQRYINDTIAMLIGAAVIITIRFLAMKYRWNLPVATYPPKKH